MYFRTIKGVNIEKSEDLSIICKEVCVVLVNEYQKHPVVKIYDEDIDELLKMICGYDNIDMSNLRITKEDYYIYTDIIYYLTNGGKIVIPIVSTTILKDVFKSVLTSYMRRKKINLLINS
jgi:hypothetical protein